VVESQDNLTVALDTELTDELIDEGCAREFVNRVQNMRKDAGFEVTDRIRITFRSGGRLNRAIAALTPYIMSETLAVDIAETSAPSGHSAEAEINGERCLIGIERVAVYHKG
jgi:isoleucyl-tRNA synthetase